MRWPSIFRPGWVTFDAYGGAWWGHRPVFRNGSWDQRLNVSGTDWTDLGKFNINYPKFDEFENAIWKVG
jgi:hypothetical protein